jgi:hypothetical protein
MRAKRTLLLSLAMLIAAAGAVAWACGDYVVAPLPTTTIKTPGTIVKTAVRDGKMLAVTSKGILIWIDPSEKNSKFIANLDLQPSEILDFSGNLACVAAKNRVYVVNMTQGKVVQAFVQEHDVRSVSFLDQDNLLVRGGRKLDILNLTSGKTKQSALVDAIDGRFYVAESPCVAYQERLYTAAKKEKGGLAIIDSATGKTTEFIPAPELRLDSGVNHIGDMIVQGDKAFLLSLRNSYGVWLESIAVVDLKTRKCTMVKLPSRTMRESRLLPGPAGTLLVAGPDGVIQFDAQGQLMGSLLEKTNGRVLTVWNNRAYVAREDSVDAVPLNAKTARVQR